MLALLSGLAVVATVLICLTAVFGALVFWPRMRHRDEPKSPLFFHHIARKHSGPATYVAELSLLTDRAEDLVAEIAEQVYWNSTVAHRKYAWASRAIRALLLTLVSMDERSVPVAVTPEVRARAIRSALLNSRGQVTMTAGQRRAVDAKRARDAAEATGPEPRSAGEPKLTPTERHRGR